MRTHISEYLLFLLISLSLIQVINWSRRDLSENPDNLSQAVTMDRWIVPGRVVIGIFGLWKGFEYVLGRTVGCLHLKRVRSENVRNQWQFSPPSMGNGVVCWIKTKNWWWWKLPLISTFSRSSGFFYTQPNFIHEHCSQHSYDKYQVYPYMGLNSTNLFDNLSSRHHHIVEMQIHCYPRRNPKLQWDNMQIPIQFQVQS